MPRIAVPEQQSTRGAFLALTVEELKPLASLVGVPPTRKGELVDLLARTMEDPEKVRGVYAGLGEVAQRAVEEATHGSDGVLDLARFGAKYGCSPNFGGRGQRYGDKVQPTRLRLFFPHRNDLPHDLRTMLRAFVPEPPPLAIAASDELQPSLPVPSRDRKLKDRGQNGEEDEPRVRQTAGSALHDLKAMLRLIDAGAVRVSEKTRKPSQAAMNAITEALAERDFYTEADQWTEEWDAASDLRIQSFAWPMLVQAAGLAEVAGTRLQLTAAGRKATTKPVHEVIRTIWEKWKKTTLLDEFSRINAIKGQQAKGRGLTAVAPRRQAVVEVLEECPPQKWIAVDELFRVLKVLAPDFSVSHDPWRLYLVDSQYGRLGYDYQDSWEILQGRYALVFLFEYVATLGLVDVAYFLPQGARRDYSNCWGTDELSCLSRYDGLASFRINALGAWCLGLTEDFEPPVIAIEPVLKVLPNRDVVAADGPLTSADGLLLERFAERTSEAVWRLDAGKILEAVEKGMTVEELTEFLAARNQGRLPQTVDVFLGDLAAKSKQLEDLGTARLIACGDSTVAKLLAHDRRLRNICQLAGERHLVFRAADEATVRRTLKELGFVLPPPR